MPKRYNTPHRSRVVKTRLSEDEYADFTARLVPYGTVGNSLRSMRRILSCTGRHKQKCAVCWAGRSSRKWMC